MKANQQDVQGGPSPRIAETSVQRLSYPHFDETDYSDDDITSVYPIAFRRDPIPRLGEDDVSPKSIAAPSLRRLTVPDVDTMPDIDDGWYESRSVAASSRRPSLSSLDDVVQEDHHQLPPSNTHHVPDEEYSPVTVPGDAYPLPRMPSSTDPKPSPSLDIPDRPTLRTASSSDPLLGDVSGDSGDNTPITTVDRDPFRNASIRANLESPIPSPSCSVSDPGPLPPKIHINSIPNSPASVDIPSFAPAQPLTISDMHRRRSSLAAMSSPATNIRLSSPAQSVHSFGVASGAQSKSTITQRRAQRMKAGKNGKKDEDGKDGKPTQAQVNRKPFESTRLKGEIYKPWLEKKDPAQRWARYITLVSIVLGFVICGILCWDGYASVPNLGKTCLLLHDDFSNGFNTDVWTREVRLDGYGNGEFEWTTNSENNSFVKDGTLYLVPTLSSDVLGAEAIFNGYTLNLTADGTCTSENFTECVAVSNSSRLQVINPVQSARLTTKHSVNIRYGKVEVKARRTYGAWPRSGEIDMLEARGNNASYPNRGVDYAQSSLHWGPTVNLDRLYLTWGFREQRRTYYNEKYHTYGLEWNDKYMWTYIDSKVSQVISLRFNKDSFWTRGHFPGTITNTTTGDVIKLTNPWLSSENINAPFDQSFYLIIDLAVGGTDGWFPDGEGGKPWLDDSGTAMSDFWNAKSKWWDTNWPKDPLKRGSRLIR